MAQANRLELAKTALLELVDHLGQGDQVGIVVYDDQARVVLRPTDRKEDMREAIRGLHTAGSTNAEAGLRAGFELAAGAIRPGVTSRVILCSDGVANVGATGPDEILKVIEAERERGIRLTTVGFGMGDYNDALMERLANKGNGRYHYVDDIKEARRVFGENLGATLGDVALDAKIQVEFDPAVVKRFRQVGYENRALAHKDFRNDKVDAGEVGPGHSVTALYELELADPESPHRLARVTLRYKEPATKEALEVERSIARPQIRGKFVEASLDFQLAATAASFAEVLRKSEHAKEVSLSSVARLAQRCSDLFDAAPEPRELLELVRIAETLTPAER
jgi:Ca-activated chloride channel family protein